MKTIILFFLGFLINLPVSAQNFERMRENMVRRQIQNRGIDHQPTLNAMRNVERHLFVPRGQQGRAYNDGPMPIGYGQTISQPYIVAYMTSLIDPKPDGKILEIGTGSGYQAAVLAEIVDMVYTIEIIPELANQARELLDELNYNNVEVITGDGYFGHEDRAPYDAIVVTAAAEYIPPPLISQLKDGGKMIIPVGSPFMVQTLMLVEKEGDKITTSNLMPVRFVPFTRKD
ncbi:MAG: protein-L-isoaspartate(D-aspartate) O-methyltransferase [Bacteroidales bacterium]